jgi:hypothetical protein
MKKETLIVICIYSMCAAWNIHGKENSWRNITVFRRMTQCISTQEFLKLEVRYHSNPSAAYQTAERHLLKDCVTDIHSHKRTKSHIGRIYPIYGEKRYSFCLMVEASDHGYVLHTRRIHVKRYRIRYDMI